MCNLEETYNNKSEKQPMFNMPRLIGTGLVKKQNERIALEIVNDLSPLIENEKMKPEFVTEEINKTLTSMYNKDEEFAKLLLQKLKDKYGDSYAFAIGLS